MAGNYDEINLSVNQSMSKVAIYCSDVNGKAPSATLGLAHCTPTQNAE